MVRQRGKIYHYIFMMGGKRYWGVCEGCSTKRAAELYEQKIKDTIAKAQEQKSVKALVENFRDELTGGHKIALSDAFELSLQKPRSRTATEKFTAVKREAFRDFVQFMKEQYPDAVNLSDVLPKHAEEYITIVRTTGRYTKTVSYSFHGRTVTRPANVIPSARTANLYQTVCAEVFRLLARDAGVLDNPFNMPKLKKAEETREAFSEEELKKIYDNLTDFTRPLFTVAIMTALREGDICLLRWKDVNFQDRVIRRTMNKTRHTVEIPLSDELFVYLMEQRAKCSKKEEYVFPAHAEMYLKNQSGVSYRIRQFLESIGIETTRIPQGRTRAVSVKDLHSCRHTFCYYAGLKGIPLAVVQSIVGHMTPEMTARYTAHCTLEDKRRNMLVMSDFLKITTNAELPQNAEPERAELHKLADTLPLETIRIMLAAGKSAK